MSPCIAAMYGRPPRRYGFHCGNPWPLERLRGELAERVAGHVLVAARIEEELSGERRIREHHRTRARRRAPPTRSRSVAPGASRTSARAARRRLGGAAAFGLRGLRGGRGHSGRYSGTPTRDNQKRRPGTTSNTDSQRRELTAMTAAVCGVAEPNAPSATANAASRTPTPARNEEHKITDEVRPGVRRRRTRRSVPGALPIIPRTNSSKAAPYSSHATMFADDGEYTARCGRVACAQVASGDSSRRRRA